MPEDRLPDPCRWSTQHAGAFFRSLGYRDREPPPSGLSDREFAYVEDHLGQCGRCAALFEDAFDGWVASHFRRHAEPVAPCRVRAGSASSIPSDAELLALVRGGDPHAAAALESLPERWQTVLRHLEVEGQQPADVGALLGPHRTEELDPVPVDERLHLLGEVGLVLRDPADEEPATG